MPREIADSDAESDLDNPSKEQTLPKPPPDTPRSTASNDLGVHFSDFLSESQNYPAEHGSQPPIVQMPLLETSTGAVEGLPSASEGQEQEQNRSAEPELAESGLANPLSVSTKSKKRSRTVTDDGGDAEGRHELPEKKQRRSRPKTYGGNSGRLTSSQTRASSEIFEADAHTQPHGDANNESTDATTRPSNHEHLMHPPSIIPSHTADDEDESPRQRNRPRRVLSLMEGSVSDPSRDISRSRSSMGNYESININFRGTGSNSSIDANPFGSLSQTSCEELGKEDDQGKIAIRSGSGEINTSVLLRTSMLDAPEKSGDTIWQEETDYGHGNGPQDTPGRPKSLDPMLLYNDLPNDTQLLSSSKSSHHGSKGTGRTASRQYRSSVDADVISEIGSASTQTTGEKRGRKVKGQRQPSYSPITLDEEQPQFHSDELAIGLPKEQYKPRPSRSRGGTNELPSKATSPVAERSGAKKSKKEEESSAVKQPTSELHLSDEAFIGLSKEEYKPRPSRSRSKRTIVDEDVIARPEPVEVREQQPASSAAAIPSDTQSTPAKKGKKTPKKTKVKRAKTSAAVLLKKTQEMLSEGEEDVMWLETQPVKVKLDLPQGLTPQKAVKMEEIKSASADNGEKEPANDVKTAKANIAEAPGTDQDEDHECAKRTDTSHNAINIPPSTIHPAQSEPKKRGRKKKSTEVLDHADDNAFEVSEAEAQAFSEPVTAAPEKSEPKKRGRKKKIAEVVVDEEEVTEPSKGATKSNESTENRPALTEKDPNQPTPKSVTSKHATSQPGNATATPQNENLETPQKTSPSTTKGPTKHSPINPTDGKSVYRVGLSRRAPIPSLLTRIIRREPAEPKKKGKGVAVLVEGGEGNAESGVLPKFDTSYVEWD